MKLSDKTCRAAKPKEKPYKLADGGGLYLYVRTDGARYWRLKYYFLSKEKLLALGVYPIVTLADAREKRDQAKKLLAAGKDPSEEKKQQRKQAVRKSRNTFEVVAREWHENQKGKWTPAHARNVMRRLEIDIFPFIGKRPIADIDPPDLLESVLRRIEKRGALDVAARVKQICGQIFRYGISSGRCKRDSAADLKGALKAGKHSTFIVLI